MYMYMYIYIWYVDTTEAKLKDWRYIKLASISRLRE